MEIMIAIATVLGSLIVLVWSSDKFVSGASSAAYHLGVPPLLVGMVIIGFGTSMPEMIISALSALENKPNIALGNAYGSNIVNIGLILGITAVIFPVSIHSQIFKRELPILLGVSIVSLFLLVSNGINRPEAIFLLLLFLASTLFTYWKSKGQPEAQKKELTEDKLMEEKNAAILSIKKTIFFIVMGLFLLFVSSQLLIRGTIEIAKFFGISDLIIALTVVALGTSLPELASSIAAAYRHQNDLAIGNIIGSNIFNTLAVVGIAGTIRPLQAEPGMIYRDIPVMLAFTAVLFVLSYDFSGKGRVINRYEGGLLLLFYCAYTGYLIYSYS